MSIIFLVACCICVVVARPQQGNTAVTPVPILVDERLTIDPQGGYGFRIVAGNGIKWHEIGAVASKSGQYTFTHPDGTPHTLSYTAGVGGFHPVSDLLPTPHPLEPWHIEQIRFAESQRAAAAAAATTQV
ncbi:cuticle protein AM1199-like [Penaeus monodon]|uniref:cuticle protein AM1199-like n=1 Tax=Penaeus monodon TaxID=6687 RepID=UPI0018A705DA|nr:cuticle protein AM1199-like [Penaeus monodon]